MTTAAEKAGMAEYTVLREDEPDADGESVAAYLVVGTVTARNPAAAVKAKNTGAGTYVAVASKFLKPLTLTVATVEQVSVS